MFLTKPKSLSVLLLVAAASAAPTVARAGAPTNFIAPGVYYFSGPCTSCDSSGDADNTATATLSITQNDMNRTSGSFSFTSAGASFEVISTQLYAAVGSTPTSTRRAEDVVVFFEVATPFRSEVQFFSNPNGSWALLGYEAGRAGTWATTPAAAPVPEPQSWALMLAGLAAAGAVVRRRRG